MDTGANDTYYEVQPRQSVLKSIPRSHQQPQHVISGYNYAYEDGEDFVDEGEEYEYVRRPDEVDYPFSSDFQPESLKDYNDVSAQQTLQGQLAKEQAIKQDLLIRQLEQKQTEQRRNRGTKNFERGQTSLAHSQTGPIHSRNQVSTNQDEYMESFGKPYDPSPASFAAQDTTGRSAMKTARRSMNSSSHSVVESVSIDVHERARQPPVVPPHAAGVSTKANSNEFINRNFKNIVIVLLVILIILILITAVVVFLVTHK